MHQEVPAGTRERIAEQTPSSDGHQYERTILRRPKLKRWRLTVLCGGPSTEREISLLSGRAVAAACRKLGHIVTEADISPNDLGALRHSGRPRLSRPPWQVR